MNNQQTPENEIEIYKRMIINLRNEASNAMTAAAEFKARLEMAMEENEKLKKKLAAAKPNKAAAG